MNSKIKTNNTADTDYTVIMHELEKTLKKPPIAHGTYTLELFLRDGRVQRFTVTQTRSTFLPVS